MLEGLLLTCLICSDKHLLFLRWGYLPGLAAGNFSRSRLIDLPTEIDDEAQFKRLIDIAIENSTGFDEP